MAIPACDNAMLARPGEKTEEEAGTREEEEFDRNPFLPPRHHRHTAEWEEENQTSGGRGGQKTRNA